MALAGQPVGADPLADKKAEAARIAAQLEAKGHAAEILTEQYNAARIKAGAAEVGAKKATEQLAAANVAVNRSQDALKKTAVQAYVHGGFMPMSNTATTPEDALELGVRRKYVNVVAERQADALHGLRTALQDAASRRATLEQAKQSSRQSLTAVESKRQAAAKAVGEQQALLDRVKGELGVLVAAEQQRKAAEEARRVQAALAARQASPSRERSFVADERRPGPARSQHRYRAEQPTATTELGRGEGD